jgi:hypothetical protein
MEMEVTAAQRGYSTEIQAVLEMVHSVDRWEYVASGETDFVGQATPPIRRPQRSGRAIQREFLTGS